MRRSVFCGAACADSGNQRCLDDPTALTLLDTLQNSLKRMDGEMEALQKARDALQSFAMQVHLHTLHALPDGEDALCLLETLSETLNRSEENTNMSDLKKSDFVPHENVEVRFIDLPPMTVAAAQYTGDEPENHAQAMLEDFIEKADLINKMPGLGCSGSTILRRKSRTTYTAMNLGDDTRKHESARTA